MLSVSFFGVIIYFYMCGHTKFLFMHLLSSSPHPSPAMMDITSLRQLFLVVANREDRKKLETAIESDPAFKALDKETARVAGVLIGAEEFMEDKIMQEGGTVDMCTALKQLRAEGHAEGIALLNTLNQKLVQDNRMDDLLRAVSDAEFQKQLLTEYELA